ncbi:uncharacterized protein LOC129241988 [Anastrepha obliqua]|uniref:uncharacterized protein LOC129241988 n=1 Tax=Anastrepha obliqua TaxID=95512 RepID=UPI002409DE37|nr:uncharacterized protein LOC129241988 [Anastrepha obliqua]
MPKRSDLGRKSRNTRNRAARRNEETAEQRSQHNEQSRQRMDRSRSAHSNEKRETRNNNDRERMRRNRAVQGQQNTNMNQRIRRQRSIVQNLNGAAFAYNNLYDYSLHNSVVIGTMTDVCKHCKALKFQNETDGLCCSGGKVKLPELKLPPEPLRSFVSGTTPLSRHFLDKIQTYNSCFQMTSFGASKIITDNFMPTFKIQGQIYHQVGSLLPFADANYEFLQIYFIGNTEDEIDRRCTIATNARRAIVGELTEFFHAHNLLVRLFKTAMDRMPSDNHKIVIRPDKVPVGEHSRRFNAPTIDDVAIVIVGQDFQKRDIVLHRRTNELTRVSETHRCYDALQYPILFWEGEDGYHFNIKMINPATGAQTNKKVSAMNYYSYRLMIRENEESHILKCRRLFHQFVVDMYAKIETERLNYIKFNQTKLRSEEYIHLRDAVNNDGNVNDIGRMIILPATYTGSPRHMHEYAQDAMAYVRAYGRPDLFITFTCNPQWSEIKDHLFPGQSPIDRHDLTARIFKQKLKSLMDFIVKHRVFGEVRCYMYSVEWQKRGLPHAHILIWLVDKITPDQIDSVISAEIPDQMIDPDLFEVVTKNMIHGPCGALNLNSPCMIDGKCSKRYPRALISDTVTGDDGYPAYRRRSTDANGKSTIIKMRNQNVEVDNRWIVPYCPLLSKTFKAHINVEYCNSVKSIKYICKYVNKGSDMAVFGAVQNDNDEIKKYQMGRYISSNEAIWRIFSFPIHERHPTVVHLAVHLENGQRVYFTPENAALRATSAPITTLTAFFHLCQSDNFARTLLYAEVPQYFTWDKSRITFQRRKQGKPVQGHPNVFSTDALGRIYTVHPNNAECFYLRLLLVNVRGPTSFQALRTINGELCATYREACQKLNLLEDDKHWEDTLAVSAVIASPHQIRTLFSIIIAMCSPSNPLELWNNFKDYMADDILNQMRRATANYELEFNLEIYNEALIRINDICLSMSNKSLVQLGMPAANRPVHDMFNRELEREYHYDCNELNTFVTSNLTKLNDQQQHVYVTIMNNVSHGTGGLFFLDAPGGTGKTFLISLLLATIRSNNNVALALASSGIAATLLEGGRTAHSALKLPLNMQSLIVMRHKVSAT